jgi:hemoglobin
MSTIYESIGGKPAVSATVDALYDRVLADPTLAPYFTRTDMARQKAHMRAFVAAALGGPEVYTGRDMAAAHRGLHVSEEAFDAVVAHLVDALHSLDVPERSVGEIGAALAPLRPDVVQAAG